MSLPCIVQVLCTTWYIQVNHIRILVTFVPRETTGRKNTVRLLLEFWPSGINPELMIEWRLNAHPIWVNVWEEFARNRNIVLQWRINKIASWMSLKSSEINNCSWIISTVLKSPFCSSSCCQTCLPSIIRPMNRLWEWILKIFFHSPEMQPLRLLLDALALNDEEDKLLSSIPSCSVREYFTGSISIQFLLFMEQFLMKSQQVLFFVVLLLPLIGMQNPLHSVLTHILRADLREFLFRCCSNPSQFIWSMRNYDPGVSIVSTRRHNSDLNSMFTVQVNWL